MSYYKRKENNTCITNGRSAAMKLRKILKSMFNNYCKTFKDVP
ncbi:stress response protein AzuC, partial [Escherichia coli]|nr:stress response protein AzuC [Escherichia coli]